MAELGKSRVLLNECGNKLTCQDLCASAVIGDMDPEPFDMVQAQITVRCENIPLNELEDDDDDHSDNVDGGRLL